ncbi:MAG TPA: hypothetical protein VJV75_09880 [Candidatus Polarisedimenticolia bacterium]|nr:hypothetical protein [Candidatus Polarisedimenticolia bacterium]
MRARVVTCIALLLVVAVAGYFGANAINAAGAAAAAKAAPASAVHDVQSCDPIADTAEGVSSEAPPTGQPPMEGAACIHCVTLIDCDEAPIGTVCADKPNCHGVCRHCPPAEGPMGCWKTP